MTYRNHHRRRIHCIVVGQVRGVHYEAGLVPARSFYYHVSSEDVYAMARIIAFSINIPRSLTIRNGIVFIIMKHIIPFGEVYQYLGIGVSGPLVEFVFRKYLLQGIPCIIRARSHIFSDILFLESPCPTVRGCRLAMLVSGIREVEQHVVFRPNKELVPC